MIALTVPVCLDALVVTHPLSVVEAKADFTRMPYWDGAQEVNPDVANISEDIVSYPFQDGSMVLPRGVHLHWTLPASLTRGSTKVPEGYHHRMLFPAVPNRWLVTRSVNGKTDKQWVVESDYIYPDKQDFPPLDGKTLRNVAIPFPCDRQKGERPFRYMGRQRDPKDLDGSPADLASQGYRLTAVGYQADPKPKGETSPSGGFGEPTFAALYPNCHSVFGLHDDDPPSEMKGVTYDIVGWYSKTEHDCIASLNLADRSDATALREALKTTHGWDVAVDSNALPSRTIFHARIEMDKLPWAEIAPVEPLTVCMGNTTTEALSAYLAKKLDGRANIPQNLEEQLEALHLADQIDPLTIDIGPKFQHARHDRGFSGVTGGTVWTLRIPNATDEKTVDLAKLVTPKEAEDVFHALNQLNMTQRKLDQATCELDCMQKQLFADWYKYMLCAYPPDDARDDYPDIDEVRFFVTKTGLDPITEQKETIARLTGERNAQKKTLEDKLQKPLELQSRPGMRFYRPHEPVLLIAGNGLRMTNRYGQSGPLQCSVSTNDVDVTNIDSLNELRGTVQGGDRDHGPGTWHPFSLDWRVELQPIASLNNLSPDKRAYDPQFIRKSYQLGADAVELTLKPGEGDVTPAASVYSGSSLMTSHAKLKLRERIHVFLSKRLLKKYFHDKSIPEKDRTNDFFEKHVAEIKTWYESKKSESGIADSVVDTMLAVATVIDDPGFHVLAQALNGFNEALLMHKQTLQLPLDEPLGFQDAKDFTKLVRDAVGTNTYVAPQPLDDFHPLRTGRIKVLDLRLVDTFGRMQDLDVKQWRATETMPKSEEDGFFRLPPRFVQPARLCFRWLSGKSSTTDEGKSSTIDEVESNAHPATTPVCGWFLPNHLDKSLMVYDANGKAQGSIKSDATWEYVPGGETNHVKSIADKPEAKHLPEHLGNLVQHLRKTNLAKFFQSIETALDNIHPARSSEHEALALLIGRPIAVVRARLKLEIQGHPAINQGWDAFRQDLERFFQSDGPSFERSSDGVTNVKIPIRLGDSRQLNDGLLGYWIENKNKDEDNPYATYQSGNESLIERCVNEETTLTMLLDPRGVVHVASGILPAEVLEVPQEQYAPAMKAIEAWFLTAPVLSPANKIGLPLPKETDHAWSWIAARDATKTSEIGSANTQAHWAEPLEIHDGWLKLTTSSNG